MTDSLPCNIVLLPSDDLAELAIEMSRSLRGEKLYELSRDTLAPHLSLYMTQLKVTDLDEAKALLSGIATRTRTFNLAAINYGAEEGYFEVGYRRTNALDALQQSVVTAVNPIRDGMRVKDKIRMESAVGIALENFKKYGYPNIGELFRPHISFTRFSHAVRPDVREDFSKFSGVFSRLALCEMGGNGTCTRIIAAFSLRM
ncbi:MAG TPA: DUF1045 domain-containing protein [Candidatus Saccharimonadales bacterium]|nr:DUF1045 domain-containing protein [Candidatus Saccharimonadales bacterium]